MRLIDRLKGKYSEISKRYITAYSDPRWPCVEVKGYIVISPDNNSTCGHQHGTAKAALTKCLLTYGRLEAGWRIIYVEKSHWYTKDGARQDTDIRNEMEAFVEQVKRDLRRAYKNFRRRFNPSLPEEFI